MKYQYSLIQADRDLFARYQTIYSGADTNLQINWEYRLRDTTWTEDCFWIIKDGSRMGGMLVINNTIQFPFLIPPYHNRHELWDALRIVSDREQLNITKVHGALDDDVSILLSYGYAIDSSRRCMCRPSDIFTMSLNDKFIWRIPDLTQDISEMIDVLEVGYENSIDYQTFGRPEAGEVEKDVRYFLDGYKKTDTIQHSTIVIHKESNCMVGLCLAGGHPESSCPLYSFIADLVVLPQFRGQGLADFMLRRAVTEAVNSYPLSGLCVTVGNPAESIYHKLGFWGGPRFTNMSRKFT